MLLTEAGDEWLALLEALEQPHQSGRVRAVALTSFVGLITRPRSTPAATTLADDVAERVRSWLDLFRTRGIAAVHEALRRRRPARRGCSRSPTASACSPTSTTSARCCTSRPAPGASGCPHCSSGSARSAATPSPRNERTRRLDTDAAAVQILTIHGSKGLQYPVVHLPHSSTATCPTPPSSSSTTTRAPARLDVGGRRRTPPARARAEDAGEELRLTYVALTRAQSQVVTWWGPSQNAANSGLSRLLFGRTPGESAVPSRVAGADRLRGHGRADAVAGRAARWPWRPPRSASAARAARATGEPGRLDGAPVHPEHRHRVAAHVVLRADPRRGAARHDRRRRRARGPGHGRRGPGRRGPAPGRSPDESVPDGADLPSPMARPAGGRDLRLAGPRRPRARRPRGRRPARRAAATRARSNAGGGRSRRRPTRSREALVPMQHTSLGPLADGLHARRRSGCATGCASSTSSSRSSAATVPPPSCRWSRCEPWPTCCAATWARTTRCAPTPTGSSRRRSGGQLLRGYLSGSIDVVLRVPDGNDGDRFVVVDYKTNRLGDPERPLTAYDYTPARMTDAMLHEHYPLQALLYSVVLHRYLRWRLPGYEPARHLGGILYLYVRGMCGPETPEVDGQPCGVFAWHPPAAMVVELSDLLAGLTSGAEVSRMSTETAPVDSHRPQVRAGADRAAGAVQPGRRADGGRRPRRRAARHDDRRARRGGPAGHRARRARRTPGVDVPRPRHRRGASAGGRPRHRRPAVARARPVAGEGRRPARSCAQEVLRLDNDLLYLDRYWREEVQVCRRPRRTGSSAQRPPRSMRRHWTRACSAGVPAGGVRRAARRCPRRRRTLDHGAHRRPGHRQDHHCRRAAGPAGRAGRDRRGQRPPPADRAERPDREGVGAAAGVGRRRDEGAAAGRPRPPGRAEGLDPAPAAGLAARQQHPLPPRPRPTGCPTTSWWSTRPRWCR